MNNQIKKILAVFLILSLINGMFVFADERFVSDMSIVEIKNDKTGQDVKKFSTGDLISTKNDSISLDYNKKLKIKISEESKFKLNNFNLGELIDGQVQISSISDFFVKVGNLTINLKNSGVTVLKNNSEVKVLSQYGINKIIFNGKEHFLLEGTQALIFGDKIIFDKKVVKDHNKIFLEDTKTLFHISGSSNLISNFLGSLIYFKNKNIENINFIEKGLFNSCIESISELTEKEKEGFKNIERFYKNVEKKCINKEILENKEFVKKFEENFENISSLKERYFIDKKRMEFLGGELSFVERIFYLQKNVSSGDLKNFGYLLAESKKSLDEERDLKNLEIGFILIDGILKNNLKFSFEKIYDFRNKISDKILIRNLEEFGGSGNYNGDKYISKIKENILLNSDFIESLLEKKNYKELDYIFANKIIYNNPKNDKNLDLILRDYNKTFNDYLKILDSSKNMLHGSAENNKKIEEIKKTEREREVKEAEIKTLLDSFGVKEIKEIKVSAEKQKIKIIKIFNDYGFSVKGENIEGFMNGGNLFYINKVEFLEKKYDLVFDLTNNVVSKMKSVDGDKFDGNGAMNLSKFKNLISISNFKVASFSAKPLNVFQDIEEKDFSHENFLKKELVRKYLESVGIITDAENISKINGENFLVLDSKIEEYPDLNIGFKIKLIEWTISNIDFGEKFLELKESGLEKSLKKIRLAKHLKSKIKKIYGDFLLREENLLNILSNLAGLGIKKGDVFLGEDLVDGFQVYKTLEMSSGNGILSGEYLVGEDNFLSARFTLGDHIEDLKNISTSELIEKIKFINKNISDLEKLKKEEGQRLERIRLLNYGDDIPDELLDGDWITD